MDRYEVSEMVCMECGTRQAVAGNCTACSAQMARYYCGICHLLDDEPGRSIYHCPFCNVCRWVVCACLPDKVSLYPLLSSVRHNTASLLSSAMPVLSSVLGHVVGPTRNIAVTRIDKSLVMCVCHVSSLPALHKHPWVSCPMTCRLGQGLGIDAIHCMRCNACMSLSIFKTHTCRQGAMEVNCPVCHEYVFDSADPVKVSLRACMMNGDRVVVRHFQDLCVACCHTICFQLLLRN
jgi:hypothetical protein